MLTNTGAGSTIPLDQLGFMQGFLNNTLEVATLYHHPGNLLGFDQIGLFLGLRFVSRSAQVEMSYLFSYKTQIGDSPEFTLPLCSTTADI